MTFGVVQVSEPTYGEYIYPRWAIAYGWFLATVSLLPIPIFAVMELRKQKGSLKEVSSTSVIVTVITVTS